MDFGSLFENYGFPAIVAAILIRWMISRDKRITEQSETREGYLLARIEEAESYQRDVLTGLIVECKNLMSDLRDYLARSDDPSGKGRP